MRCDFSRVVRSIATASAVSIVLLGSIACGRGASGDSTASPAAPRDEPLAEQPVDAGPVSPAVDVGAIVAELHLGVDLSMHSGTVDWRALKDAGHTFAFVKATEGVDLLDSAFGASWQAMKQAGLVRGAYHFFVTEDDPDQQADFFIANVHLEPGDLAPVVDIEVIGHDTPPGLADRLRTFVSRLETHYGAKPIIYTGPNFWDQNLDASFGEHPLWVAEYGVEAPRLPKGWSAWHLWQWQGDASVPGVEKAADLSKVNRDGPDLGALVIGE